MSRSPRTPTPSSTLTVAVESEAAPAPDRRSRRRQATIEEILERSVEHMAEVGVAALSLSTVARRMGMQPPSLYQYFPSRLALYDALFHEGNRRLSAAVEAAIEPDGDPLTQLRASAEAFVVWSVENPVFAQLMFWRPVPGFEPSPESFALAAVHLDALVDRLRRAVEAGQLAPEAAEPAGVALYTAWTSGIVSQQLANEPGGDPRTGRFTQLVPDAFDMYVQHFAHRASKRKGTGRR
jgi:AcrR family transcriptional regulator